MTDAPSDPRHPLHPEVATIFEMMRAARAEERVFEAEIMRSTNELMALAFNAGAPAVAVEREIKIPCPAGDVRALVFAPQEPAAGVLPLIFFIHGGGFVIMSPETHAKLAKQLAVGAGAVVVSIDYRRAPEHPYPAPLDDCVAAFGWVRENAASLGGDPLRIAIAGDSAGGNLTAATILRLLAAHAPPPVAALLICAWTDLHDATEAFNAFGPDDLVIDTLVMDFFRESYAPRPEQWDDPFVSPFLGDVSAFPPSCVIVGGIDPLRDDGILFAQKLRAAGREADLRIYEGMPHDFILFPGLAAGEKAVEDMCAFLRSKFQSAVPAK